MSEQIGFIGLGNMGHAMAMNLHRAGYQLRVYNRDASKAHQFIEVGAHQATKPAEVIEPGSIVITMVANDEALEQVTLGEGGLLERLAPGGIHISMSTVSPDIARQMTELHQQRGCHYIAAPVFGRPEAAAAKKLWICVAGTPEAKQRIQPVLLSMGQQVFDFGEEPEKANIVKVGGNFLIASAMEAIGETLTMAEKHGIDRSQLIDMYSQTMFACPIYQNYGKMIAERRFTPVGFLLQLALKDINLVLDSAEQAQTPMPLASLLHDRLLRGVALGRGESDWVEMTRMISEDAGLS